MKKNRLFLSAVLASALAPALSAADFQDGELYYNILDADAATVEVAAPSSGEYAMNTLTVPAQATEGFAVYSFHPAVPAPFMNAVGVPSDNTVSFSVRWNDDIAMDNLTELVYTEGPTAVKDVVAIVLKEDDRFYAMNKLETGERVAYGFDTNGDHSRGIYLNGERQFMNVGLGYSPIFEKDLAVAKPASDYDHWKLNGEAGEWKIFVNGELATYDTMVNSGDALILEYCAVDATAPSDAPYTFYLRPGTEQGVWMLDPVTIDTANGKKLMVPMIATVLDDAAALYGVGIGAEVYAVDGETSSSAYSASVTNGKKGGMMCSLTVKSPEDAIVRPFLNIRKDWGNGTMETRRVYGSDSHVSTIVAKPVTVVSLKEYAPGETIEIENMGTRVMTVVYEPEDADFKSFVCTFGDESVASLYKSNPNYIVAHSAGETVMTVSTPDGSSSQTYNIKVAGIDSENKPADGYQDGLVFLNEDWFTHTSSSLNYIDADGTVYYRAYGNQNDNKAFGATACYAMFYADKLFVISKQAWDGGDKRPKSGGRVVVADAKTFRNIASFDEIGGDGRAAIGVSPEKVYIGHTKGVRVMHLGDNITIEPSDIEGITVGRSGQMGNMVKAGKYVFATSVGSALVIIDTETDVVAKTIEISGIQTVARSLDGRVWIGCANTLQPIDPGTLELGDVYNIGAGSIGCSSSSWRSGNLVSSTKTNTLFWSTANWNGSNGDLVRWDIDDVADPSALTVLYKHDSKAGFGSGYGTPCYDARTDTWIFGTNAGFGVNALQNWVNFVDASTGALKQSIKLSEYFWFPSMPVMPDKYEPSIDLPNPLELVDGGEPLTLELNPIDEDNFDSDIALTLSDGDAAEAAEDDLQQPAKVVLSGRTLTVTPLCAGTRTLHFELESNGRVVNRELTVNVKETVGIDAVDADTDAEAVYYRTDGVRVQGKPSVPGVYIEKKGSAVRKVVF